MSKVRWLLGALVAVGGVLTCTRADAIPAFARKTGMGCPACHESWPKLNDFGELFRDRGYRIREEGAEGLMDRPLDYFPVTLRSTTGYQFTSTSHQATDGGDKTVQTGAFLSPSADLIFGTALSEHASVFVVATGFADDGLVNLESAWARLNTLGTTWLNVKVGRHELDLPVSEHRSYTLTAPFLVYHYHPGGGTNTFAIGDNQLGVEVMGHGEGPGLRYAVSIMSASGNPGSDAALSSPALYAHLTYTRLPWSSILTRVRVGLLADIGWAPTAFQTLTPMGGMPAPIPGTGTNHKGFGHIGGEVQATLGPIAAPLSIVAVWLYGQEPAELVPNATQDGQFHGGFIELDWTPRLPITLFFRFDDVSNIQQADPTQPSNSNDQNSFTFGARHALWLSPWGSMAGHLEVSSLNTENAAATPTNPVRATTVFAGLDFAI